METTFEKMSREDLVTGIIDALSLNTPGEFNRLDPFLTLGWFVLTERIGTPPALKKLADRLLTNTPL